MSGNRTLPAGRSGDNSAHTAPSPHFKISIKHSRTPLSQKAMGGKLEDREERERHQQTHRDIGRRHLVADLQALNCWLRILKPTAMPPTFLDIVAAFRSIRAILREPRPKRSRVGEEYWANVGARIGSGEPWRIKKMGVSVSSFIRSYILRLHLHSLYLSPSHPPFHHTVALYSGSKAR